jgi:6-phosphogluconolactonase
MTTPEVFVVKDRSLLLDAVAARLVTALVDRLAAARRASLLVAGDPLIADLLDAVARGSARGAVDWPAVQVWWANDTWRPVSGRHALAVTPLLTELGVRESAIHTVPVDGPVDEDEPIGAGQRPEDLAEIYARQLRAARQADDHGPVPAFDVALLAVAHDGSVAGLHPERPSAHDDGAVAVDRVAHEITLTTRAVSTAREVWLLAAGSAAAPGVHLALSTAGPFQVPAAGSRGSSRTLVLLDEAAAGRLPHALRRLASP